MDSEAQVPCQPPPMESGTQPPRPVPFEDREAIPGFWERVFGMVSLAFTHPMELFERVPVTEGLAAPWRFYLLMAIPYLLFMGFAILLFGALGFTAFAAASKGRPVLLASGIGAAILSGLILLMPLFIFLGMVVIGALDHFFLWIWGGTRNGFGVGQTIRAAGYTGGIYLLVMLPFQVLGMIPFVGILCSLITLPLAMAFLVFKGMGLARLHRADTWRGVTAMVSIFVLSICCAVMLVIGVIVLVLKETAGRW